MQKKHLKSPCYTLLINEIKGQIEEIRKSGECNMVDIKNVAIAAISKDFHELANFIEEHPSDYVNYILFGKFNKESVDGK